MEVVDEKIVVYLCGCEWERVVWYRVVLETSYLLSKGEKRDREGHRIEGTSSSHVAVMPMNKFGTNGCWAVIGDDIYCAGGWRTVGWDAVIEKDLVKHNIHHNDSSSWETVTSLAIPRAAPFLAPVGRKLAIVAGTTMPGYPYGDRQMSYDGNWRYCGEIYDLDSQSLDYMSSQIKDFDPYDSISATTVLEDPTRVVFYNLKKGTVLILDASSGAIIENNKSITDPFFALCGESFADDPLPPGLQRCESIAPLLIAAMSSAAVFHRRTFYWFTNELMLYGYDMDLRQWFRSECLQQKLHPLKLEPVLDIPYSPLLLGLPNGNFLVILPLKKVKPVMASLYVEKKLNTATLEVNVEHIQQFHPSFRGFLPSDGIAIRLKNTGS